MKPTPKRDTLLFAGDFEDVMKDYSDEEISGMNITEVRNRLRRMKQ